MSSDSRDEARDWIWRGNGRDSIEGERCMPEGVGTSITIMIDLGAGGGAIGLCPFEIQVAYLS